MFGSAKSGSAVRARLILRHISSIFTTLQSFSERPLRRLNDGSAHGKALRRGPTPLGGASPFHPDASDLRNTRIRIHPQKVGPLAQIK